MLRAAGLILDPIQVRLRADYQGIFDGAGRRHTPAVQLIFSQYSKLLRIGGDDLTLSDRLSLTREIRNAGRDRNLAVKALELDSSNILDIPARLASAHERHAQRQADTPGPDTHDDGSDRRGDDPGQPDGTEGA